MILVSHSSSLPASACLMCPRQSSLYLLVLHFSKISSYETLSMMDNLQMALIWKTSKV